MIAVWGTMALAVNAGAMQITISPGPGLAANAAALAAFQRSADAWDAIFSDPIMVTINADLGTFSDPSIIGSTSTVDLQFGYNTVRNQLVADSLGQADKSIVGFLPTSAQFAAQLPAGFLLSGNILASKADLKAMGFNGLDATYGASDATITFNSAFSFYYGISSIVPSGLTDFQSVATHELGHALGFLSAVDQVDQTSSGSVSPNPLDLYRFGSGNIPTTTAQFTGNQRSLLPGSAAFTSDTVVQYGMSTGISKGDGRQASHWKDDAITGVYIGVMDPTLANGFRAPITDADIRALELIGYDLDLPEPSTVLLMAGGMIGLAVLRRWRSRHSDLL